MELRTKQVVGWIDGRMTEAVKRTQKYPDNIFARAVPAVTVTLSNLCRREGHNMLVTYTQG